MCWKRRRIKFRWAALYVTVLVWAIALTLSLAVAGCDDANEAPPEPAPSFWPYAGAGR